MAHGKIMHFHNSDGASQIEIGVKEFMCIGALPPFDHPHVYLDMGADNEIVCPYCSTHFVHTSRLQAEAAEPISAIFNPAA